MTAYSGYYRNRGGQGMSPCTGFRDSVLEDMMPISQPRVEWGKGARPEGDEKMIRKRKRS